jgi:hypothetical protein
MRDELGNSLAQLLVVATWLGRPCAERWNGVALQWRHTVAGEVVLAGGAAALQTAGTAASIG